MLGIGALVAAWGSWGTFVGLPDDDNGQWRIPLAIQLVPAGILALLILLFPESPRWQAAHGKTSAALITLAKLHAHGDTHDPWVLAEHQQILDSLAYEEEHAAKGYMELLTHMPSFRRLFLVAALQASVRHLYSFLHVGSSLT
jgi:MFS family permease